MFHLRIIYIAIYMLIPLIITNFFKEHNIFNNTNHAMFMNIYSICVLRNMRK